MLSKKQNQSTTQLASVPPQTIRNYLMPCITKSQLDNVRSSSKTMRSFADEQIQKRLRKEPRAMKANETKYKEFLTYYHNLIQNRIDKTRNGLSRTEAVSMHPFQYNRHQLADNKTFVKILRQVAFLHNAWKRDGVHPEIMIDAPLLLVKAMGPSIPKKFQDTESLKAIALAGLAIGNLPEGGGYSDYDEIMGSLIQLYNNPHYAVFHSAIKNIMIAVIWRYRSGMVHAWRHMTQADEQKYLRQTGIRKDQLMTTTYQ